MTLWGLKSVLGPTLDEVGLGDVKKDVMAQLKKQTSSDLRDLARSARAEPWNVMDTIAPLIQPAVLKKAMSVLRPAMEAAGLQIDPLKVKELLSEVDGVALLKMLHDALDG